MELVNKNCVWMGKMSVALGNMFKTRPLENGPF